VDDGHLTRLELQNGGIDVSLIPENTHPAWSDFLDQKTVAMLDEIESCLGENINPPRTNVLRFLTLDPGKVKVVILGQDPYPEPGAATGRAFEVGTLKSWHQPFRQVSLKNIVRLIYKTYNHIEHYSDIPTFTQILPEIADGRFVLESPDRIFESWERQGVLLLNVWLTSAASAPGAHRRIWHPFSVRLLNYLSGTYPELTWFLWGKHVISYKAQILSGTLLESRHPMMCSSAYPDDFLKSDCFLNTMNIINWKGK